MVILLLIVGCELNKREPRNTVYESAMKEPTVRYFTNPQSAGPYSDALQVGRFLFISNQVSINLETLEFIDGSIEQQTRQVMNNIMTLLRNAGFDSSHIVHCTIFLKNSADYSRMNLIYGGYFNEGMYPTRSVVIVSNFIHPKADVEISAIAYKP